MRVGVAGTWDGTTLGSWPPEGVTFVAPVAAAPVEDGVRVPVDRTLGVGDGVGVLLGRTGVGVPVDVFVGDGVRVGVGVFGFGVQVAGTSSGTVTLMTGDTWVWW